MINILESIWSYYGLADYIRPIFIVVIALVFWNFQSVLYKLRLFAEAILYLIFCNDKSWKKDSNPKRFFEPVLKDDARKDSVTTKTIIFVRHGESTWNDTLNKGHHRSALNFVIWFIPNLIKAVLYELYMFVLGIQDSWFYDSPLSQLGISQVDKLHVFLKKGLGLTTREKELISIMCGDPDAPPSRLVSSSLRRAISTVAICFQERMKRLPNETILVLPSLQEISRNPDTLSITPPYTPVTASWIERDSSACAFQDVFTNRTDMSLHKGNKPINTNGLKRMKEFCKYVFSQRDTEAFIVGGHSIWFRAFFQNFLPHDEDHVAKKRKIVNAGAVGFTLMKVSTPQGEKYMIDPKSVTVIYGGF
mmetsp:Transcript_11724/g.16904  ORF Transcript_11724/g.16904 Transcript_11724/m.16904 type:complete len:363 (+) Transcript_11724:95-1183(+)|eukprot:CAMPEP_0172415402 /NCGR_PEP_ID=MMETSP1064-20121228/1795_1 /TAXON_ID=202472 /ORGANISM="Aulacoseira subarctica , Strain CCAP 1002/5" /LENGTH=362 /DNA_ID=CAMNT_0013152349 /DNA_START=83 /DNA_END=1171 /DNA_ORIENTATION=-